MLTKKNRFQEKIADLGKIEKRLIEAYIWNIRDEKNLE